MLKRFNQIIYSNTEPVNKNDIWIDNENVVRIYKNGSWEIIIGGGAGGSADSSLLSRDFSDDFNNDFAI